MLKPIPNKILKHSATLKGRTATDVWQNGTYQETELSKIAIQPEHRTQRGKDDTEVTLSATLFFDCRRSLPRGTDFVYLQNQSQANGGELEIVFGGQTFTVVGVDALYDDESNLHHYEVALQ